MIRKFILVQKVLVRCELATLDPFQNAMAGREQGKGRQSFQPPYRAPPFPVAPGAEGGQRLTSGNCVGGGCDRYTVHLCAHCGR